MWRIKREMKSEGEQNAVAKYDISGTLVTDPKRLLDLYKSTYQSRLSKREMDKQYKEMEGIKTYLFSIRMEVAKQKKSSPWNEEQLFKVLKDLKNGKCSDPLGMNYELFRPENIGHNLFNSLLLFCNQVKEDLTIIRPLKLANITSIFKRKGSRLDMSNDRGIFSVVKIRSIIDKLIYNEEYEGIDEKMSNSNV